jgi:hypothetical protein
MLKDKFNWVNSNAINAKHAETDKFSTEVLTHAQHQLLDQPVIATNNWTPPPTNVTTAQQVKSQEMVEPLKTLDAEQPLKTAMLKDKFNWVNSNAINARDVLTDKFSTEPLTLAQYQDQLVIATKSIAQ